MFETVDNFIIFLTGIFQNLGVVITFIYNVILGLRDFILSFFSIAGTLLNILYFLFSLLEIFVSIVLNPYLLMMFILGTGFYYASFTAETKKDMLIKTGVYYKYVGETISKIFSYVYNIVSRLIVGIIDMI